MNAKFMVTLSVIRIQRYLTHNLIDGAEPV